MNKFTEQEIIQLQKELFKLQKKQRKAYLMLNKNIWRTLFFDFTEGIARGLGFFIGATVIITILVFLLTKLLDNVPIAGEFFEETGKWLQEQQTHTRVID